MDTKNADTPEALVAEIRRLVEKLTELTKSQTDTKEPIIFGNGLFDVRALDGLVRLSLGSDFGWVSSKFDPAFASNIAGQIHAAAMQAMMQRLPTPAEVVTDRRPIH